MCKFKDISPKEKPTFYAFTHLQEAKLNSDWDEKKIPFFHGIAKPK